MVHLGRYTQALLLTCGLSLVGCSSFRERRDVLKPRLGGESASHFDDGEGIGGPRGSRGVASRSNLAGIAQTSAETDEDGEVIRLGGAKGDSDVEQTSLRPGGILGAFSRGGDCGPNGCGVRGGHGKGQALLDGSGANLGGGSRRVRRDMGTCNPMIPRELRKAQHPLYVVEAPDVLYIEALELLPNRPISGERLVRQDGTISLGYYGQISVAGLTLPEIEEKIRKRLEDYVNAPEVYVDVALYNSKVFYVLGQTQQTGRLPITGNETVLDGIVLAGGLTNFADKNRIFLARPNPGGGCDQVLHIDYRSITECGDTRTNYQLVPGDRIVVMPTKGFQATVWMDNYLTPVERITNLFALFRFASSSRN